MEEILRLLKDASMDLDEKLAGGLVGLALFGSWARSEATDSSDVDVFVVTKESVDFNLRSEIYRVLSERLRKPITLIAVSRSDLAKEDLELTPLLFNIVADAVVLYDRDSFLAKIIRSGRRLIDAITII